MNKFGAFWLIAMFVLSAEASASYLMFCELTGEIVSEPVVSGVVEFELLVEGARDIELEGFGSGNPDCHLLKGERVAVVLAKDNAGDLEKLVVGAPLTLERYDIDAINRETGAVVRSIRYVRRDL